MTTPSIAETLRQLLPQVEQNQQQVKSLLTANAEKDRQIARLQTALEASHDETVTAQETIIALRSLLRREREQASQVKQQALEATRREDLAEQRAKQAEAEKHWAEAEKVRLEQDFDDILKEVEEDTQLRIQEAEKRASEERSRRETAEEESAELARRLRRTRRKSKKKDVMLDQLHAQEKIDRETIQELQRQLDLRPTNS
jgi:hypothetical protein